MVRQQMFMQNWSFTIHLQLLKIDIIASFKNAVRTEKIKEFEILKTFFNTKGLLNENNYDILKNIKIKRLWFEK